MGCLPTRISDKMTMRNSNKALALGFMTACIAIAAAGCGEKAPTEGEDSIYLAAARGDMDSVGGYIRGGFKVNTPDEEGMTVMHHAAKGGHVYLLEMLLEEFSADPFVQDNQGRTPMQVALDNNQMGAAGFLRSQAEDY
jgi:ankyrin repeat protein